MKNLIVDNPKYDGKKISSFLFDKFPNLEHGTFFKALRKKDIRINNVKISVDTPIHLNDSIIIFIPDEYLEKKYPSIKIVYEDENILVAYKPEGISVTENDLHETTLTEILKKQISSKVEPCHRLDLNTKGLVLYAKNAEALNILLKKFKDHEIEKRYKALVYGILKPKHELLSAYLFKDSKKSMVLISDKPKKDYLEILTEYTVLEYDYEKNTSLLDITLHTGRTHQIRAHLSHIGYPIIGDGKYGKNEINKKFHIKKQELEAYYLSFNFTSDSGILNYLNKKVVKI